jgi:hypothetical protein
VWSYLCGLALHGLDELVLHQAQYQLTPLSLHDWPPSTPFHEPYAGCLPTVFDQLKKAFADLPVNRAAHPVLVIAPYRGLMARLRPAERAEMDIHKASYYADSPAGALNTDFLRLLRKLDAALIGYDVISERDFALYTRLEQGLQVGRCAYQALIVAEGSMLGEAGDALLQSAVAGKINVIDMRNTDQLDCVRLASALALPLQAAEHPLPASVLAEVYEDGADCRLVIINNDPAQLAMPVFTVTGGRYLEGAERTDSGQQLTLLPGEVRIARLLTQPSPSLSSDSASWDYQVSVNDPNVLLLDQLQLTGLTAKTSITVDEKMAGISLVSLVPLAGIRLNGKTVPAEAQGAFRYPEMLSYLLPTLPAGDNQLEFTLAAPWQDPAPLRCWLTGDFHVMSTAPWETGPRRTLRANGPFRLSTPNKSVDGSHLVENGYPFYTGQITYSGAVTIGHSGRALTIRLGDVSAAAAHVFWDGEDLGWVWGPRWEASLARQLTAGTHTLTVELFTTSFNLFGPHHHVLGDPPLVTTSHYTGQRDFAQPPEAPVLIVPATHAQPIGLGRTVSITWEDSDVD